ncbi:hypothetical protein MtrunA17_Chr2g0303431 [Medicago truncatula]|uniref:Uncharacterized protein n=1 Tax=Medicago truncatula TaxID=3880 RepID=A0A072V6X4_MEDTR|nr:hypothetical protein MTR_2g048195 [Medicago truncatula]RHN73886.1 hypothetical protein MtrunA17_Chr2g0303431 [Medicago truncatula]
MGETRAAVQLLREIGGKLVKHILILCVMINFIIDAHDLYSEVIVKRVLPDVVTLGNVQCIVVQLKEAIGF